MTFLDSFFRMPSFRKIWSTKTSQGHIQATVCKTIPWSLCWNAHFDHCISQTILNMLFYVSILMSMDSWTQLGLKMKHCITKEIKKHICMIKNSVAQLMWFPDNYSNYYIIVFNHNGRKCYGLRNKITDDILSVYTQLLFMHKCNLINWLNHWVLSSIHCKPWPSMFSRSKMSSKLHHLTN